MCVIIVYGQFAKGLPYFEKKYVRSEVFQLHYVFFQYILFLITYLYFVWVIYNIFAN